MPSLKILFFTLKTLTNLTIKDILQGFGAPRLDWRIEMWIMRLYLLAIRGRIIIAQLVVEEEEF